ncbi:MAG: hypothetical protein J2P49_06435 [Methylocapsa sp.]|nr:hypothetical protein [Methylocapsa sp.]
MIRKSRPGCAAALSAALFLTASAKVLGAEALPQGLPEAYTYPQPYAWADGIYYDPQNYCWQKVWTEQGWRWLDVCWGSVF